MIYDKSSAEFKALLFDAEKAHRNEWRDKIASNSTFNDEMAGHNENGTPCCAASRSQKDAAAVLNSLNIHIGELVAEEEVAQASLNNLPQPPGAGREMNVSP